MAKCPILAQFMHFLLFAGFCSCSVLRIFGKWNFSLVLNCSFSVCFFSGFLFRFYFCFVVVCWIVVFHTGTHVFPRLFYRFSCHSLFVEVSSWLTSSDSLQKEEIGWSRKTLWTWKKNYWPENSSGIFWPVVFISSSQCFSTSTNLFLLQVLIIHGTCKTYKTWVIVATLFTFFASSLEVSRHE